MTTRGDSYAGTPPHWIRGRSALLLDVGPGGRRVDDALRWQHAEGLGCRRRRQLGGRGRRHPGQQGHRLPGDAGSLSRLPDHGGVLGHRRCQQRHLHPLLGSQDDLATNAYEVNIYDKRPDQSLPDRRDRGCGEAVQRHQHRRQVEYLRHHREGAEDDRHPQRSEGGRRAEDTKHPDGRSPCSTAPAP